MKSTTRLLGITRTLERRFAAKLSNVRAATVFLELTKENNACPNDYLYSPCF